MPGQTTIIKLSFFIVVNIVLAFYMGNDLASVTGNAIGQPMATVGCANSSIKVLITSFLQILLNSFGKKGTLVVWSLIILSQ